ncbi:MAG: AAA family ATPase [Deltaproteobacteria bacterium]|nr:AAA family ATPase [Deltaproteobacteria bacterium]
MELRRYLEILWQRKISFLLIIAVITATAFLGSMLVTPVYESSSLVMIKTNPKTGLISQIPEQFGRVDYFNNDFVTATIESILESEPVVKKVIVDLNIRDKDDELFEASDFVNQNFIKKMFTAKKGASVDYVTDSNVFEIIGYSTDPQESSLIANRLVKQFMDNYYSRNDEQVAADRIIIENSIAEVKANLTAAEEEEERFMVSARVIDVDQQIKTLITELSTLENDKATTERLITDASSKLKSIKATLRKHSENKTETPNLVNYKKQLLALEKQLASFDGASDPKAGSLKEQIDSVKKNINDEIINNYTSNYYNQLIDRTQLFKDFVDSEINSVIYAARRDTYNQQINSKNEKLKEMTRNRLEAIRLKTVVDNLRTRYSTLLSDLEKAKLASLMSLANIEVIQPATVSDNIDNNRYFPKGKKKTLVLAGLAGIFIAFFWVFLLEYMDNTVRSEIEVKDALGASVLGAIPAYDKKKQAGLDAVKNDKEALNSVLNLKSRIALLSDKKVYSIVSCRDGDGKSTVAASLAYVFARSGEKVLLIDADFQNQTIGKLFNISSERGILNVQGDSFEGSVTRAEENLDVISCAAADLSQVITARLKISKAIESLRLKYDRIIIDTASIKQGGGAAEISAKSDSAIFVASAGKTVKEEAGYTLGLFREANINVAGVVLNKVRRDYLS